MSGQLRTFYEAEARELIDRLTRGTSALQGAPEAESSTLADVERAAHTLKGAAHVVGERNMAALAHSFEDAVALYRKQSTVEGAAGLLRLADGLDAELEAEQEAQLRADAQPDAPRVQVKTQAAPMRAALTAPEALPQSRASEPPEQDDGPPGTLASSRPPEHPRQSTTLRVEAAEAGRLLDQVSGSGAVVERLRATLSRLEALEGSGSAEIQRLQRADLRRNLADDLHRLERGLRQTYATAQHLQLGEAQALLLEAGRIARTTASAQGKHVQVVTSGGAERVDTRILQALGDALIHLLRNAVAHGIETPAERMIARKPATGTVEVAIERRGAELRFVCADDGRGISLDAIRQAAVRRGELSLNAAASASEAELLSLLLRPGFSLREHVDSVSGRGVGLDAVHEAIASVGGRIAIRTLAGKGTFFTLTVPAAVSALLAVEVSAGGARYMLPASSVEHTLRLEPHQREQIRKMGTLLIGTQVIPLLWLKEIVSVHMRPPSSGAGVAITESSSAVVITIAERRFALGVDRVEGVADMMLRQLPAWVGALPFVAGASLGVKGVPVLALDPAGLADAAFADLAGVENRREQPPSSILPVLVIDDSLTTRMLEQSILEAEGYQVDLATSAEQALEKARARHYGLFLVDVEMPGMNGFDFISVTRQDPELRRTPCILVTSLDSPEHRERGRLAGASSYIVKGEFNQQIYLDRIRRILLMQSSMPPSRVAGGAA
jgi:two-component system chemotaxis sensor kinase CheA